MTKTYVIVDDDRAFVTLLKKRLDSFPYLKCLGVYYSTVEAAVGITRLKPDILFLDMEIDSLNGLDVLAVLEYQPKTIVVSSNANYMEEAFSFKIYDYLKKPLPDISRLQTALNKVI
ncbi:response regulator [uncultured Imperialibacter sp.]|uniref:LytR/AlgR family response regulator transcription factor n=1 Tax=uncultured Imperialibacter sp. TaxID=1672639 RepID=UPI0030D8391A|tara:strand:+ start:7496 stop:7846 length:351 start_codon:yes stop_codon:yes gene_type:complete